MTIKCVICNFEHHAIINHLSTVHNMTPEAYVAKYNAPVISDTIHGMISKKLSRTTVSTDLTVKIGKTDLTVDTSVKGETCLPMPKGYQFPTKGEAGKAFERALRAVKNGRNAFIWGMPGTGKDAFVHAFSALTRRPALALSFTPGKDLDGWFYKQVLDSNGSRWEFGAVWKAVTQGVEGKDGIRRAPMILLSDVDRADPAQAEWFRILCDSISGRILDPHGNMVTLFRDQFGNKPQFVCTANSVGSGDARGRMTSSNPIDGSIMDRLGAKIEAHYMTWAEEGNILKGLYPELAIQVGNDFFDKLGLITKGIRKSIAEGDIYGELTMRGLCDICNDATDIWMDNKSVTVRELLTEALMAWTDGLDSDNRFELTRLVDPVLGSI